MRQEKEMFRHHIIKNNIFLASEIILVGVGYNILSFELSIKKRTVLYLDFFYLTSIFFSNWIEHFLTAARASRSRYSDLGLDWFIVGGYPLFLM